MKEQGVCGEFRAFVICEKKKMLSLVNVLKTLKGAHLANIPSNML